MRVAIVLGFDNPFPGAGWRRIEYFAEYIARRGYQVYVLGTISPRSVTRILRERRVERCCPARGFTVVNAQPYLGTRIGLCTLPGALFNLLSALLITLLLVLLRPRAIIVSVPRTEQVWASYLAARLLGAVFIADLRDLAEDYKARESCGLARAVHWLVKALNTSIYRRAHAVLVVVPGIARALAERGVATVLAPNGADTRVFRPCAPPATGYTRIVFAGSLGEYYRLEPVLLALARLDEETRKRVRVAVLGRFIDKRYERLAMGLCKRLRLCNNIELLGVARTAWEVAQTLCRAHAGLVPRDTDTLLDYSIPAKTYEYIAAGLPVIAITNKDTELHRFIERTGTGWTCTPADIECIARALTETTNPAKLREKKRNTLRLRPAIDRAHSARKLHTILQHLLEQETSARRVKNTYNNPYTYTLQSIILFLKYLSGYKW